MTKPKLLYLKKLRKTYLIKPMYVASAAFKMKLVIFAGRPTDGRSDDGRILLLCCDAFLICIRSGVWNIVAFLYVFVLMVFDVCAMTVF